jgi:GNAT superfamily N-acetyltransferase
MRPVVSDAELVSILDEADESFLTEMCARTPGARVERRDGLFLAIGAVPSPVIVNTIVTAQPGVDLVAIDRALAIYQTEGKQPSILTRDHADTSLEPQLAAAGWNIAITLPGMVLDARTPGRPLPPGITIHRVETEIDRERFVAACQAGFASEDADREAVDSAFRTLDSLVGGTTAGFYAIADARAVACAMSSTDSGVGMGIIGWVGTDPGYRRRGIGAAVTAAATNAGFDLGARWMGLQATPMGLPVYEKLGYRTIAGYKVWFR